MIIQNSTVNIVMPRVENIKRKFILHEDLLKTHYNEANILPIPDEASIEIPRIVVTSKGEHSQLSISPEAVSLETVYTDDFTSRWDLCRKYIMDRMGDIFGLTEIFTDEGYNYIGIVSNLLWNDITAEGTRVLFQNLFGKIPEETLDGLLVKYTHIIDSKYYANITLQNVRQYKDLDTDRSGFLTDDTLATHTIGITIDVNDRYSYNTQSGYRSNKDSFEKLICIITDIIENRLEHLVKTGVYFD